MFCEGALGSIEFHKEISMSESLPTRLRKLVAGSRCLVAPGAVDALAARLIKLEGFEVVYMSGAGTTLTRIGMPDIGLLTMTEMVDNAARVVAGSELPVIADADTGYGNALNVRRTIQHYERAGVAGVHLEDQMLPKRCGHFSGKVIVPVEEMKSKIKAAVDARINPDFQVIARTDALAVEGFAAALDRAAAYRECGADMLFVEGMQSLEQIEETGRRFKGVPLLFNSASSTTKTPHLSADELGPMGYRVSIFPNWMLLAAIPAMRRLLRELRSKGTGAALVKELVSFEELNEIAGLQGAQELEARYGLPDEQRARIA